jgi:hypothetical protein
MEEIQALHDEIESADPSGEDAHLPDIQAAIDGIEGARDSLAGLTDTDEAE